MSVYGIIGICEKKARSGGVAGMKKREGEFILFPERFGFFPYVFLFYLVMPAYSLFFEDGWKRLVGYVVLGLFLVTYRQLYFFTRAFSRWLILQIAIVLFLSVFYHVTYLFLGFFTAHFIGWLQDRTVFQRFYRLFFLVLTMPILVHLEGFLAGNELYLLPFIVIMLISPFGIRSMNDRMELERKLEEANETIKELVKREERVRIARDLHDTLGHTLSLITLKSQLVARLVTKDAGRAREEAVAIERTSRAALRQVRELVSDMRAITVEEELLEVEKLLAAAQISMHVDGDSKLEEVSPLIQNIISMCLREAVTNVVKHSHASNCYITIEKKDGKAEISIRDDGRGFSMEAEKGNGLNGMIERLELIDGSLEIYGRKGTELVIIVPVVMRARKDGAVS